MSAIENFLSRVDAKQKGIGQWSAKCPVPGHGKGFGDRSPSLSIGEGDDGRVLLRCFAGCTQEEITNAVGLDLSDLFPKNPIGSAKPIRRPFFPSTVFEIARQEIGVVAIIAGDIHQNKLVDDKGYERLLVAIERLNAIEESAYKGYVIRPVPYREESHA